LGRTIAGVLALRHITFAAADPGMLARFWADVLGYETEPRGASWAAFDPDGQAPELLFERRPRSPTIELPIHLDVNVPDREAEVQRLLTRGARLVSTKTEVVGELAETWTHLRDPEGNGFCVQSPEGRAPPGPYVGNITFSSAAPRVLGAFWSDALGWPEQVVPDDFIQMLWDAGLDPAEKEAHYAARDPSGRPPRFLFQHREKSRPEHYPIRLDFSSDDDEADVARLLAAGASLVETQGDDRTAAVLRDPEGNPFSVE
jgi:predicted enzyme related to lactoylglutathione lyase